MKIYGIYDKSGPKYHRVLMPLYLMPGVDVVIEPVIDEELLKDCDILFINRVVGHTRLADILDLRAKYGFKLVVDFDDHWQLDPSHYLYNTYQKYNASELMEAYIYEADCVTVTHERLAEEVRKINPNVCVLPNAIPKTGQFDIQRTQSDLTRLFWAGGITHVNDIQLLFQPVKSFRGLPVKMVMGGYSKKPEYYQMRNAYTRYGRMPHELIPAMPVDSYYSCYSQCDIALIPLVDNRFNSFKSNLKILEAANVGANVVVSNVHPYKDVPGVEYVNDLLDWKRHISNLINNPDYAKMQAGILKKYVAENFDFGIINEKRKELFLNVTARNHREVPATL